MYDLQVILVVLSLVKFSKARPTTEHQYRKILPFEEDFDSEYDYKSEEYSYLSLEDIRNAITHKKENDSISTSKATPVERPLTPQSNV